MADMFRNQPGEAEAASTRFRGMVDRVYRWYTLWFVLFVVALGVAEQLGLPREWIGFMFLLATVAVYGSIGILCRTTDPAEYYVAGRRVPAIYNGMATGADWMSAASFLGLAGTLYLTGYNGLAFILGWSGGFCLVALFLAPYLRKFGQFTIPDFLGERYGGDWPRLLGIGATLLCSFTYVVAQIYGVGLITSRLLGVAFELGIFLGLGGILICSFLGGMRAVTWTQVAQYIVIIVAYMIPVVWLSVKQTGIPIPQAIYGYQLEKVTAKEADLMIDTHELSVRQVFADRALELERKLADPARALVAERAELEARVAALRASAAPQKEQVAAEKALARLPREPDAAVIMWREALDEAAAKSLALNGMPRQAQQFAGDPHGTPEEQVQFDVSRRNFLALVFCLMVGTAALPHVLTRYYTTPNVRQARESVTWSIVFIVLLYFTAPALAVLVKFEVFHVLVGTSFDALPAWMDAWNKVDPKLLSITDINQDGVLQLNEMSIGGDIIVLATAEIAGLALCHFRLGGGWGAGCRVVDSRWLAADHCQCLESRPVLQNDRPQRRDCPARHPVQNGAAGCGVGCRLCGRSKACGHFVFGVGGVLVCRCRVLSCTDAGHFLEAHHGCSRLVGHVGGAGHHVLLHGHHPALAAGCVWRDETSGIVVGH
jgi:cation/acetate symporter